MRRWTSRDLPRLGKVGSYLLLNRFLILLLASLALPSYAASTWVETNSGRVHFSSSADHQEIAKLVSSAKSKLSQASSKIASDRNLELIDSHDDYLQRRLNTKLRSLKLQKLIKNRKLSVALADVTDPIAPRLASVNGNQMMYAASLPKIAILFGAYEMEAAGKMTIDKPMRSKLTDMIRSSSNSAATEVLLEIGMPKLAKILQSDRYKFYDKQNGGGIWVGKPYARKQAWKRDPLNNLSHGATALQVARFYYMMETGQLVSKRHSAAMKAIMGNPALHHKFVGGLEAAGRHDAKLYRKSGTWRHYHADSAIVEHAGRTYIAVALAKHKKGGDILKDLIVAMDDVIVGTDQLSALEAPTSTTAQ